MLIELLIVVAIIAILSAIAVPNFMEAQTRSKVARIIDDHQTIALSLENYQMDHSHYLPSLNGSRFVPHFIDLMTALSARQGIQIK